MLELYTASPISTPIRLYCCRLSSSSAAAALSAAASASPSPSTGDGGAVVDLDAESDGVQVRAVLGILVTRTANTLNDPASCGADVQRTRHVPEPVAARVRVVHEHALVWVEYLAHQELEPLLGQPAHVQPGLARERQPQFLLELLALGGSLDLWTPGTR